MHTIYRTHTIFHRIVPHPIFCFVRGLCRRECFTQPKEEYAHAHAHTPELKITLLSIRMCITHISMSCLSWLHIFKFVHTIFSDDFGLELEYMRCTRFEFNKINLGTLARCMAWNMHKPRWCCILKVKCNVFGKPNDFAIEYLIKWCRVLVHISQYC